MLILKNSVTVHIAKCKNSNARTPQNFKGHAEDLHYITYTECTLGQLAYLFMAKVIPRSMDHFTVTWPLNGSTSVEQCCIVE